MRRSLLALAVLLVLAACSRRDAPTLQAKDWRTWTLPPEGPSLPTPRSLATGPRDELAVLDTAGRVTVYDAEGRLLRRWHMLDVKVGKPEGLVILADGRVVVCDTHYHRVVYFDSEGHWLRDIGRRGEQPGEFIYPVGICKDAAENLYICEYGGNDRIQKFTREGQWLASFGGFGTAPGCFQRPSGLAWHAGLVYVADAINNRVLVFRDDGQYQGLLGAPNPPSLGLPYDIALGPDGVLNIIEYGAGRLTRMTPTGRLVGRLGSTGTSEGQFATPWGIAIDSRGRLFVADTRNRRIVRFGL